VSLYSWLQIEASKNATVAAPPWSASVAASPGADIWSQLGWLGEKELFG